MQLRQLTLLAACLLLALGSASAQEPPRRPNSRPSPDEAVKTILDLSDAQLQELKDLRESVNQKRQENATEIRRLQQKRRELLQTSPPDAVALADVLVQEENLRKQVQDENKAFRDAALNLLTGSQKEKIERIQEAVKLARDAGPLARFGLLEGPGGPGFVGPGGPGFGPGGPGFGPRGDVRFIQEGATFEVPVPPPAFAPGGPQPGR